MKKLILTIFSIILVFTACGALQLADVARLSPGMTQVEVDRILGKPVRILSSSYAEDGEINVFEYITYRNESYAVEFFNGRLNRYDFMYENVPSNIIEPNPTPVYPVHPVRPIPPAKPQPPVRPQPEKPTTPVKPQPERPQPGRPTTPTVRPEPTRPTETNKPGTTTTGRPATRPTETSRPSSNSKPETSKPATRPSGTTTTGRPATKTTTTETSTTKTNPEEKKTNEPSK